MSSPKGWPSQQKEQRTAQDFATVSPSGKLRHGLDVNARSFAQTIASDAAEASSTTYVINATSHLAVKGDIIRFTSGTHDKREVVVDSVTTNAITLCETLESAVANGVTFDILRHITPKVDSDGKLSISAVVTEGATAADGDALPDVVKVIGGYDGSVVQAIKTDSDGNLQVDVLSSALPTGAATEAKQDTGNTALAAIKTSVELLDNAISGNEMQVDVVAALPAGDNNIGNVDVVTLPALPAGTNNIGDVDVLTLPSLPAGTNNIGDVDVLTLPALPAGTNNIGDVDVLTLPALPAGSNNIGDVDVLSVAGRTCVAKATIDYSSTSVTSAAYVELISSVGGTQVNEVEIFDSSGLPIILATGAAASESDKLYIIPGGNGRIPLQIAASTRVALKALSTTAAAGRILVNFYS